MVGHLGWGDQIFLDVVETATVDLPFFAVRAFGQAGGFAQTKVKRDKVKRRPDPRDGRHNMQPAHGEFRP